jgi:isoquinoline 1-oxidoreductase beta subunit
MAKVGEGIGISRRTLLIGGGAGVGLVLAWRLWPRSYEPNLRVAEGETLFNAFLKIGRDGRVTVAVPQTEIGQGVYTSLPQILADELGADWRTVAVEPAPISPLYANRMIAEEAADDSGLPSILHGIGRWVARGYATRNALMLTAGSTSVRAFEAPLRGAGAAARALLSMAAADRWGANWEELDTRAGFVWRGADRIAFGALAEAAVQYELPAHLPVRGGTENRLTGQSLPRLDIPSKIDGSARFCGGQERPAGKPADRRRHPSGGRRARRPQGLPESGLGRGGGDQLVGGGARPGSDAPALPHAGQSAEQPVDQRRARRRAGRGRGRPRVRNRRYRQGLSGGEPDQRAI